MKPSLRLNLALLAVTLAGPLQSQSFYFVSKNQFFFQTSASTVVPDPVGAFSFRASAATAASVTLPGGDTVALPFNPGDNNYLLDRSFDSKAGVDAAFPNGTYRLTGANLPSLSLNLPSDNYPAATPQVVSATNGTWSDTGMLVVDPTRPVTLNFSTFTGYATSGFAGHMNFYLTSLTEGNLSLEQEIFSQPAFGAAAQPAPFTSYTIPAGRLTSGRVYEAWLNFDTIVAMDVSLVPGAGVGSLFGKEVRFFIAAQAPGTSTPPPVIVAAPASVSAALGGTASLGVTVTVGGSNQISATAFLWQLKGGGWISTGLPGGKYSNNGGTLIIQNLTAADAGEYTVTVVTAGGFVTSAPISLTVGGPTTPVITTQPRGATVNAGTTLALTVAATGTPSPQYQWRKDGANLPGATSDTLVLPEVTAASAGNYTVLVSNSAGSIPSSVATVTVTSGQPSRLPNLSVRTSLAAAQTLFVGFATNGTKVMLVRGVGPTLAVFGLNGGLPDPMIELYSGASRVDENNDWSGNLTPVFTSVGAFALTAGSKDAALQRACTGAYTAQVKGAAGSAGVVLVEVYDTGGAGKLVNVSARNLVGTGDNLLIAGFVVDGTAAKTLLIRGVGAKLAEFGVPGVLADPKLEIYNSAGLKIAENDSWNALLQPVARGVGAFDLTLGSRDAALLITLAPGSYTAQISGVGGTTGEALVEVYEVP